MEKGNFVAIEYVGRLETGEIFDLTDKDLAKKEKIYNPDAKYVPVTVIIGAGFVIPGLDEALMKMDVGKEEKVEIEPEKAFGKRNPELIRVVPTKIFKDKEPKQGMIVNISGNYGRIQSVSPGRVRVDFNNPLAGKKLIYNLKIIKKIVDKQEQIKSIFDFFGIMDEKISLKNNEVEIEIKGMHLALKNKISSLITNNVEGIEKVKFIEEFIKEKENKNTESKKQ